MVYISMEMEIEYLLSNSLIVQILAYIMDVSIVPFHIISNFLCVYLNFDFTNKLYLIICYGCNKYYLKCFIQMTHKEIELTGYQLLSNDN